ncbi:hypothetical protein D3C71_1729960 [compost metagenome]
MLSCVIYNNIKGVINNMIRPTYKLNIIHLVIIGIRVEIRKCLLYLSYHSFIKQ